MWFLKRKNQQFLQLFWGSLKNGKIIKRHFTRKQWLLYSVESKLFLISKYDKTIDKVLRKKILIIISNCPILTALSLDIFFSIKMMETIPDQLESCRSDVLMLCSKTIKIWNDYRCFIFHPQWPLKVQP